MYQNFLFFIVKKKNEPINSKGNKNKMKIKIEYVD